MTRSSENLDDQLKRLMQEACGYPVGDPRRQSAFSRIVSLVMQSRKLWYESTTYYPDALQDMWEYCFRHLDDPENGYRADICRVTTWFDDRLKKILRRHRDRARRQLNRQAFIIQSDDGKLLDPVDNLVARPDPHSALDMWTRLLDWISTDPEGILLTYTCKKYSHVNAQILLQKRIAYRESWDEIEQALGVEKSYLAKWYSRHCNALLHHWGRAQGYLNLPSKEK